MGACRKANDRVCSNYVKREAQRVTMATMPAVDPGAQAADSPKQRLRLRRFLVASAFSVLYLVVLAVFRTQDMIDQRTLLQAFALVAVLIAGFSAVFRSGLNLRFPDPSLTGGQMLASVFTMLYVVYRAPTRGSRSHRSSSSR